MVSDVLHAWRHWTCTVPEELTSSVALIPFPDVPMVPEPLRGRYAAHVRIVYTGDAATGDRLVAPLRAVGPRLIDSVDDMPDPASSSIFNDPTWPHPYYGTNVMLRELDAAAVPILELAGPNAPIPCIVQLNHLGGALARPPAVASAVGHRKARYLLRVLTPLNEVDISSVRPAHQRLFEALTPWSSGRSLNFMFGEGATPDLVRSAYDPGDYLRLARLKAVYDPSNMFRLNHNIPPEPDSF